MCAWWDTAQLLKRCSLFTARGCWQLEEVEHRPIKQSWRRQYVYSPSVEEHTEHLIVPYSLKDCITASFISITPFQQNTPRP